MTKEGYPCGSTARVGSPYCRNLRAAHPNGYAQKAKEEERREPEKEAKAREAA